MPGIVRQQSGQHSPATATLLQMLEEGAERVQRLRAELETDRKAGAAVVQVLPSHPGFGACFGAFWRRERSSFPL